MRLLVITQKVDINDDNLGFFHRWVEKFSEKLDEVYVICLSQGKHDLPKNVHVFSMGKERGVPKIGQLFFLQKHLIKILPRVDGVFSHMCPIYAVASFPLVKIFRKRMILWFLHKNVGWRLKLAEKLVDEILTASEESCRLKNRRKIKIVGHGIDIDLFKPLTSSIEPQTSNNFKIFSAGRISPIKDQQTLIEAIDVLVNQKNIKDFAVKIIGSPLEEKEKEYFKQLKESVERKGLNNYIEFLASVSYVEMPRYYQNSDIFVNLSRTGSVDKVVLEAMACGAPVLTCNEAFESILDKKYLFREKDPQDLADKILNLRGVKRDPNLREIVVKHHNLDNLMDKIINVFD